MRTAIFAAFLFALPSVFVFAQTGPELRRMDVGRPDLPTLPDFGAQPDLPTADLGSFAQTGIAMQVCETPRGRTHSFMLLTTTTGYWLHYNYGAHGVSGQGARWPQPVATIKHGNRYRAEYAHDTGRGELELRITGWHGRATWTHNGAVLFDRRLECTTSTEEKRRPREFYLPRPPLGVDSAGGAEAVQ